MDIDAKIFNNINKQNSAINEKNYTPQLSEVYSRDARLVQYLKINQYDPPY